MFHLIKKHHKFLQQYLHDVNKQENRHFDGLLVLSEFNEQIVRALCDFLIDSVVSIVKNRFDDDNSGGTRERKEVRSMIIGQRPIGRTERVNATRMDISSEEY